jgi:hypothetical protein
MPAMGNAKNTPAETKAERIAQRNADLEEHPAKKSKCPVDKQGKQGIMIV